MRPIPGEGRKTEETRPWKAEETSQRRFVKLNSYDKKRALISGTLRLKGFQLGRQHICATLKWKTLA